MPGPSSCPAAPAGISAQGLVADQLVNDVRVAAGAQYRVHVDGNNGADFAKAWSFTTGAY